MTYERCLPVYGLQAYRSRPPPPPPRSSPPALPLRESSRAAGTVQKHPLAPLSKWAPALVAGVRLLLKGGSAGRPPGGAFASIRALPHGPVAAGLGLRKQLGLDRLLAPKPSARRAQILALSVARLREPASQLAPPGGWPRGHHGEPACVSCSPQSHRGLAAATTGSPLSTGLDAAVGVDALHGARDWLLARQERIARFLAKRPLAEGGLGLSALPSVGMGAQRVPGPGAAIPGPARRASCRARAACWATRMDGRCRGRSCPATRRSRPRGPRRAPRCGSGAALRRWGWGGRGLWTEARIREEGSLRGWPGSAP